MESITQACAFYSSLFTSMSAIGIYRQFGAAVHPVRPKSGFQADGRVVTFPAMFTVWLPLSVILFLSFLSIPRWRRYALQVLVIPMAFVLFASFGGAIVVISLHELRLPLPQHFWSAGAAWLVCGLCGAWLGNLAAKQVSRRFGLFKPG